VKPPASSDPLSTVASTPPLLLEEDPAPEDEPAPLDELDDEPSSDTVASPPSDEEDPSSDVPPSPEEEPSLEDPSSVGVPDELPLLAATPLEPLDEAPPDETPLDDAPASTLESGPRSVDDPPPPHPAVTQAVAAMRAPRRAERGRPSCNPFIRREDMAVPPSSRPR
jgi:hypothetical protein